jgi:hypothetical protein
MSPGSGCRCTARSSPAGPRFGPPSSRSVDNDVPVLAPRPPDPPARRRPRSISRASPRRPCPFRPASPPGAAVDPLRGGGCAPRGRGADRRKGSGAASAGERIGAESATVGGADALRYPHPTAASPVSPCSSSPRSPSWRSGAASARGRCTRV